MLPISCDLIDLSSVLLDFPAIRSTFPIKYLGLPLTYKRLRRVDYQPLLEKVGGRLAGWQGRLLTPAGRTTLVKSVLTSIPIYYLTIFKPPKMVLRALDRCRRHFLWAGNENVSGGKCKISWDKVCRPAQLGGLGVLNLTNFVAALRLRWLWQSWKSPSKPWVGLDTPCDDGDRSLFTAATRISLGDGQTAQFWYSAW